MWQDMGEFIIGSIPTQTCPDLFSVELAGIQKYPETTGRATLIFLTLQPYRNMWLALSDLMNSQLTIHFRSTCIC